MKIIPNFRNTATLVGLGLGLFAAVAPAHSKDPSSSSGTHYEWSKFKSMSVENSNGDSLGNINDLVFHRANGHIGYVIVAPGGIVSGITAMAGKAKLVPPPALTHEAGKRDTFSVNIDKDRWSKAPEFRKDQLAEYNTSARANHIYSYFLPNFPTPTGRDAGDGKGIKAEPFELASTINGQTVVDKQNQKIGRITDFLIDWSGHFVNFAILDTGSSGKTYAVPLHLLMSSDKSTLMLNVDSKSFADAKSFDSSKWKTETESSHIYLYKGL